jgi:hypothetical protein
MQADSATYFYDKGGQYETQDDCYWCDANRLFDATSGAGFT